MRFKILLIIVILLAAILRFYHLDSDPPGLYQDEVAIGYNAYTILHTGKDEYGTAFPLFFKSFGDYKNPVYIYATAVSIAIFGENDFAVRFPSALAGVATVFLFYFFVKDLLFVTKENNQWLPFITAFLLAISPWHIQFSRAGFEVNFGLFFFLLGLWLYLLFYKSQKTAYIVLSLLCLIFTIYIYHSYRIISPIAIVILTVFSDKRFLKKRKLVTITFLVTVLVALPLFIYSVFGTAGVRFNQTSAFSEYPTHTVLQAVATYPLVFIKNYLSFFSPIFLFINGDTIGRHQMTGWGLFYRWQLPLLLFGIYYLLSQAKRSFKLAVLGILGIVPIAGAIVVPSPHALRSLPLVLPLTIVIAIGLWYCYQLSKRYQKLFVMGVFIVALFEFSLYVHDYYIHYPKINALDWGAGYKQMISYATNNRNRYAHLVIDKSFVLAPEYINFYNASLRPIYVGSNWQAPKNWKGNTLYIRPDGIQTADKVVRNIYLPNGDIYAKVYKI